MFSGIVEAVGSVVRLERQPFGVRLLIDPHGWAHRPRAGHSIAVQGCCLTFAPAADDDPKILGFDVVSETLRRTTLGRLGVRDPVNLEACLTPASPIGGHYVQGHIDGIAVVAQVTNEDDDYQLTLQVEAQLTRYIVPKGSVTLDGVSLTVAEVEAHADRFTVALIPTTLVQTTLGRLKAGDPVNLETDVLVRAVVHNLQWLEKSGGVTRAKLREAGFVP